MILMKLFLLSLLLIFTGCKSHYQVESKFSTINIPTLDTVHTVELGETLLDKGFKHTFPAISTNTTAKARDGLSTLILKGGLYYAHIEDDSFVYYLPTNATKQTKIIDDLGNEGESARINIGLARDKRVGTFLAWHQLLIGSAPIKTFSISNNKDLSFKETEVDSIQEPSFRQQFIYNGKIGNNLKFLYREFSNNYARAPFSQEVQYDFNESKTIGFKGCRIEIVKASNQNISYKVLKGFPQL